MNRGNRATRRSPPPVIWFALGLAGVALLAPAVPSLLAWQAIEQTNALHLELETLKAEVETVPVELQALQETVNEVEHRVVGLEAIDLAQQLESLQAAVEGVGDAQEVADLRTSLVEVQTTVDALRITVDSLAARLDALETGASVPPEARLRVDRQRQSHNLSCESSAASMVAQYHGVDLSEAAVLAALPRDDNPYLGFRGNVDGPTGGIEDYGVYAGPIQTILNARGLRARLVDGGLAGIKAAIARGNPVIAWVTFDCQPSTPTTVTVDGREMALVPFQHVVVVTGYDTEGVWANDPWDGQEDFYTIADFERGMAYFGDMAIEVAAP